jgi:hypothetical protein
MSRKIIIASIGLALVLVVGGGGYYFLSHQPQIVSQRQEAIESSNDLWKETKIYKNDYLGFSIEYPNNWYLEDYSKRQAAVGYIGGGLFDLYNWDPNKFPEIPEEEMVQIDCWFFQDDYEDFEEAVKKSDFEKNRILKLLGPDPRIIVQDASGKIIARQGPETIRNPKILTEIPIKGGIVYLIQGQPNLSGLGELGGKYGYGVFYNKKSRRLMLLTPYKIPDRNVYINLLKRVKIF